MIAVFVALVDTKAEFAVLVVTMLMVIAMAAEYWRFRDEVLNNPNLRR